MLPQFADTELSPAQTIAATRLLLRIARVDGARTAEEIALIRQFYEAGREADWPEFGVLLDDDAGADFSATFTQAGQRELVVATCLMVAFADGCLIGEELAAVHAVAAEIGLPASRVDELLALVKDYMLAQLARLPDAASVAVVAGELG
jgi:uncharacterized tellurite resistance protein B-like protein